MTHNEVQLEKKTVLFYLLCFEEPILLISKLTP